MDIYGSYHSNHIEIEESLYGQQRSLVMGKFSTSLMAHFT